jgi:hypothetical protein
MQLDTAAKLTAIDASQKEGDQLWLKAQELYRRNTELSREIRQTSKELDEIAERLLHNKPQID